MKDIGAEPQVSPEIRIGARDQDRISTAASVTPGTTAWRTAAPRPDGEECTRKL